MNAVTTIRHVTNVQLKLLHDRNASDNTVTIIDFTKVL